MSADVVFQATVIGSEQIKRRFLAFDESLRGKLRVALSRAGALLQAAEESRAPRLTGDLADTIRVRLSETGAAMTVTVRPSKFYAQFMEFGVVNHGTKNNQSRGGIKTRGGKLRLVARVRELRAQGTYRIAPRPFIQPAWDATEAPANELIRLAVAEAVAEEGR